MFGIGVVVLGLMWLIFIVRILLHRERPAR